MRLCKPKVFQNFVYLVQIACTLPATSCECEHRCSVLRALSNYICVTMGQEKMSSLALSPIDYDSNIDVMKVVDKYIQFFSLDN